MTSLAANQGLKIGEVAADTGLPVKTIRYYEDIGLLTPVVARSKSGYRLFDPEVFNRLAFIKRGQSLGLSLSEIQEILAVSDAGHLPCGVVKDLLETKLADITEQIQSLQLLKSELQGILSGWQEQPPDEQIADTICPNIQQKA
ncbi:MAG: heavy metal-responsive transcriptional regulator [Chroococcales cyanobacterium]